MASNLITSDGLQPTSMASNLLAMACDKTREGARAARGLIQMEQTRNLEPVGRENNNLCIRNTVHW